MSLFLRTLQNTGRPFIVAALWMVASPGAAQTMSFSVYTDASVNSTPSIVEYVDVDDNSSGCVHGSYATTARITSPLGRVAASTSSGLYGTVSLALNAEEGNYSLSSNGTYNCSCIHGIAGFGGSGIWPFRRI